MLLLRSTPCRYELEPRPSQRGSRRPCKTSRSPPESTPLIPAQRHTHGGCNEARGSFLEDDFVGVRVSVCLPTKSSVRQSYVTAVSWKYGISTDKAMYAIQARGPTMPTVKASMPSRTALVVVRGLGPSYTHIVHYGGGQGTPTLEVSDTVEEGRAPLP